MFEKFVFSAERIRKYYETAARDFHLLEKEKQPELMFYVCYNVIIKLAMAVCAKNNLRVKSQSGHHVELVDKLAEILKNSDIKRIANKIRVKRNRDLYDGGISTSEKEGIYYLKFCRELIKEADNYLFPDKLI